MRPAIIGTTELSAIDVEGGALGPGAAISATAASVDVGVGVGATVGLGSGVAEAVDAGVTAAVGAGVARGVALGRVVATGVVGFGATWAAATGWTETQSPSQAILTPA